MPIKSENKHLYPDNWKELRSEILKRDDNKCVHCGIKNYTIYLLFENGERHICEGLESEYSSLEGDKTKRIVLTIAHLDHNPENNDKKNLGSLCQRCHFRHDRKDNIEKRKQNLDKKRGQANLFENKKHEKPAIKDCS